MVPLDLRRQSMKRFIEGPIASNMAKLAAYEKQMLAVPDPDSRSMATSGRGSGVVGYNV